MPPHQEYRSLSSSSQMSIGRLSTKIVVFVFGSWFSMSGQIKLIRLELSVSARNDDFWLEYRPNLSFSMWHSNLKGAFVGTRPWMIFSFFQSRPTILPFSAVRIISNSSSNASAPLCSMLENLIPLISDFLFLCRATFSTPLIDFWCW